MKRKEILINITLIFLIFLTILQASLIWIKAPGITFKKTKPEQYNTEEFFKELLKPNKLIVNFGDTNHTVLYHFPEIWKDYIDVISTIFMQIDEENISEISKEDYLKAQENKSIVFVFNQEITGRLFLNLTRQSQHASPKIDFAVKEMYISEDNIFISNSQGAYKLKINLGKNPEYIITNLNTFSNPKFQNFYELYNIPNNLYIPVLNKVSYREIYYKDEIKDMKKQYKNNLAARVLNQNIDYIREITQEDGTTYVFEDRFLKILSSGMIIYENTENFQSNENNLFISLKTAVSFISSKMGMGTSIKLTNYESIKSKNNYGYRFHFNLTENSIPVYMDNSQTSDYIIIEVFSDHVKSYKQMYRGALSNPDEIYKETPELSLDNIISENINVFAQDEDKVIELNTILENISDIDFIYIDYLNKEENTKLFPAIKVIYKGRTLLFSLKDGKFLMER